MGFEFEHEFVETDVAHVSFEVFEFIHSSAVEYTELISSGSSNDSLPFEYYCF